MDVRLPSGEILRNVPDGTTRAQIVAKLKASGRTDSWLDQPETPTTFTGEAARGSQTPVTTATEKRGVVSNVGGLALLSAEQLAGGLVELPKLAAAQAEAPVPAPTIKESAKRMGSGILDLIRSSWQLKPQEMAKATADISGGAYDTAYGIKNSVTPGEESVLRTGPTVAKGAKMLSETGAFRATDDWFRSKEKEATEALSPEVQAAIQKSAIEHDEQGYHIGEGVKDPWWWANGIINAGESMLPGIASTKLAATAGYASRYTQALAEATARKAPQTVALRYATMEAQKAAKRAAVIVGGLTEGGISAGPDAKQTEDTINSLDEATMMNYAPYRILRDQGLTHEQARARVATDKAMATAIGSAVVVGLTGAPLNARIAQWATETGLNKVTSRSRAAIEGMLGEGVQEAVQSGAEQVIQNIAEQPITGKGTWEGVLDQMAQGFAFAAPGGTLLGGLSGGGEKTIEPRNKAALATLQRAQAAYTTSRQNLADVEAAAADPAKKVTYADLQAARDEHRTAAAGMAQAALNSGLLDAKTQQSVAQVLQRAKDAGVKLPSETITPPLVVPEKPAAAAPAEEKPTAKKLAKPTVAAAPLNADQSKRLAVLNSIAAGESIKTDVLHPLVGEGLVTLSAEGHPVLLPAGRRQRKAFADAATAAEEAAVAEEPVVEKPQVAEKPQEVVAVEEPAKVAKPTLGVKKGLRAERILKAVGVEPDEAALAVQRVGGKDLGIMPAAMEAAQTKQRAKVATTAVAALKKSGGFTLNPATGEAQTTGWAFAPSKKTERVIEGDATQADVAQFMADNAKELAKPGRHVGGWKDGGKTYLDIAHVTADRAEAERLARAGKQRAITNLDTLETVNLGAAPKQETVGVPHAPAVKVAAAYKKAAGITAPEPDLTKRVNPERAKQIADAFEAMPHEPNNPEVKRAYDALVRETMAQWQEVKKTGLKVEFIKEGQADPYANNPRAAIDDVRNNNHLWVYPTTSGFGEGGENAAYRKDNPMLQATGEVVDGHHLLANDVFRIVHDYFGHIQHGNGFRANGEEAAWRIHSAMYSPEARAAMTTETRGQNSWVNYGPHGEKNRIASAAETVYAPQKIGLLPKEFWSDEPRAAAPSLGKVKTAPEKAAPVSYTKWYDRSAKTWVVQRKDAAGNQIGDAVHVASKPEAEREVYNMQREDNKNVLRFKHFTQATAPELTLEPARQGTGLRGEERKRGGAQVTSLYAAEGEVEPELRNLNQYNVEVPERDIYDANMDPLNLRAKARVPVSFTPGEGGKLVPGEQRFDFNEYERLIREAGYKGYYTPRAEGILRGQARMFEPVKATRAREVAASVGKAKVAPRVSPETVLRKVAGLLTPQEKAGLNATTAQRLVDTFNELPDDKDLAAAAIAGQAKRGWYRRSAEAITNVFGADAPRFAATLAALSPQTSVEQNFKNAVAVFVAWDKSGRPTDRGAIVRIMRSNLFPGDNRTGKVGVLPAWVPNTVRALTAEEPENVVLSGPKVDSFAANLRGETNRVTLDAWMANFANVDQGIFKGALNVAGTSPGLRPGYLAYTARIRQAAQRLTELTGEPWTPAEVQETVWSWAKTLYEQADKYGALGTAQEILDSGELTDELINASPDFATLFTDPSQQRYLRQAGYGEQLDRLAQQAGEPGAERQAVAPAEGDSERLRRAARRLDALKARRESESQARREAAASISKNRIKPGTGIGTAAFRKWFGKSKVVDSYGNPMTVYHSSRADITAFDPTRGAYNYVGKGVYFTDEVEDADQNYATRHLDYDSKIESRAREIEEEVRQRDGTYMDPEEAVAKATREWIDAGPVIYAGYLSLQNPLRMQPMNEDETYEPGTNTEMRAADVWNVLQNYIEGGYLSPAFAEKIDDDPESENVIRGDELRGEFFTNVELIDHLGGPEESADTFQAVVRDLGFDGIAYTGEHFQKNLGATHYVAFEPAQFKSYYNSGTWNPDTADMAASSTEKDQIDAGGIHPDVAHEVARQVSSALGVPVNVAPTLADLPPEADAFIAAGLNVNGLFVSDPTDHTKGEMWIVAETTGSREEAMETALHETVGHLGTRALLGAQWESVMDGIAASFPKEVATIAEEYGLRINHSDPYIARMSRQKAADEVVAYAAGLVLSREGVEAKQGAWNKIIAYIRDALRKIGLLKGYSDADINALIFRARDALKYSKRMNFPDRIAYQAEVTKAASMAPYLEQTKSPAFKRWFATSKVLDQNGLPLRVYHATSAEEDFAAFDVKRGEGFAIHFGTPGQAADRIRARTAQLVAGGKVVTVEERLPTTAGPRTLPVYLRVTNPLRIRDMGNWGASNVSDELINMGAISLSEASDAFSYDEKVYLGNLRELLRGKGYDGLVYKNEMEVAGSQELTDEMLRLRNQLYRSRYGNADEALTAEEDERIRNRLLELQVQERNLPREDSYAVFSAEQIKSAVSNKGTYSLREPDIAASVGEIGDLAAAREERRLQKLYTEFQTGLRQKAADTRSEVERRAGEFQYAPGDVVMGQKHRMRIMYRVILRTKAHGPEGAPGYRVTSLEDGSKFDMPQSGITKKFTGPQGVVRASLGRQVGPTGNANLDSFLGKMGAQKPTLRQRWSDFRAGLKDKVAMAMFDQFHGIKRAATVAGITTADSGYMDARLSSNSAELVQAMMEYGHPIWKDGAPDVAGGRGLLSILQPLGDKLNLWLGYMVAVRANRLMGEGRENLFTPDEIKAGMDLAKTHPEFPVVAEAYAAFQKKVLDFAQEAGVINPDMRALWENQDYIPFYRMVENGEVTVSPRGGSGLGFVRNQIVQLKGGKENLGDPLENIVRNWLALTDASLKAHASRAVIDAFDGTGLVTPDVAPFQQQILPKNLFLKSLVQNPKLAASLKAAGVDPAQMSDAQIRGLQQMFPAPMPAEEGMVSVWRNGRKERWMVHDTMLFQSLQGISSKAWGPLMELLRAPKRLLTATVTITPQFAVKNVWRDMWHTFIIGTNDGKTITPIKDTITGTLDSMRMSTTAQAMLAGGASFSHGYIHGGSPSAGTAAIRRTLRAHHKGPGIVVDTPLKAFRFYRKLLNASENANRVAIYNKALKSGRARKEALYEARDILDFGMRGNNPAVRFLVESVPFLNARLQGLYRLGRGFHKGTAAGIFLRGSLLAAMSLAILAHNWKDDRYKELSDDQKSNYWHFFDVLEPGDHWKIPKPFETGVIFGTVPEVIGDAFLTNADEPDRMAQAAELVAYSFGQQLNLSPQPQLIWPMLELAINKNTYTGAPILTEGDQGVLPEDQVGPSTSPSYRELARLMPEFAPEALRSPKQLEHLGRGYMGNVQDYVLLMTDKLVREITGEPAPPRATTNDWPGLRDFRTTGPSRHTKYMDSLYDIANEAEKTYQSWNKATQAGTEEGEKRAAEIEAASGELLDVRKDFARAVSDISKLKKEQRQIQLDETMTPDQKRTEMDAIQQDINDIAKDMWDLRPGGKLDPAVGAELIVAPTSKKQQQILEKNGMPATADLLKQLEQ